MSEQHTPGPSQGVRLKMLAADSYIRHCKGRAVECAEGDLLGQALACCSRHLQRIKQCRHLTAGDVEVLEAVLAKAKGEKP